ncbi:hypothetical protein [Saccharopolyspora shandongensis]|uniref:hypothetical protein n=1 Tax=Saccharopolyspora shandongensis TaxID=418495 RepID=UPI0033FB60DF
MLEDQGVHILEKKQRKYSTPNVRGFLPALEWSSEISSLTRPELAQKAERTLGQNVVGELSGPRPVTFVKGIGEVVFGEFAGTGTESGRALLYATKDTSDGHSVAICLFGSMDNYADFVVSAGAPIKTGWTCSSAPSIYRFIEDECRITPSWESVEELARGAVKVACAQGENGFLPEWRRRNSWNRGFTYGDVLGVGEWLAEVYLDFDFTETLAGPESGHHRVLIGAPLWLRTPTPEAIRIYSQHDAKVLDEKKRSSRISSRKSSWRKLFFRGK